MTTSIHGGRAVTEAEAFAGGNHEWTEWKFPGLTLTCCKHCGIVRRADGGNDDKPCKGIVRVALREGEQR